jgi:hypothetical protein
MAMMKMASKLGGGSAWLDKPGIYHAVINTVNEQPTTKNGAAIDGIEVTLAVQFGEEEGKQFNLTFYNPKETDTEKQQQFAMAKLSALVIAAGATLRNTGKPVTEANLGEEIDLDLQSMVNSQVVVELDLSEAKNPGDKQFIRLKFDHIYHIDDPRVAKTPKHVAAVNLLPASRRRKPESFDMEKLTGKAQANQPAAKANGKPSVDDLDL